MLYLADSGKVSFFTGEVSRPSALLPLEGVEHDARCRARCLVWNCPYQGPAARWRFTYRDLSLDWSLDEVCHTVFGSTGLFLLVLA